MYEIYSPDLALLGVIEKFSSMQWVPKWHTAGLFELHLPYDPLLWPLLVRENLIVYGDDAGIIEYREKTFTDKDGDLIEIKGRFLAGYCDRRVLGVVSATDTPENIMRRLVTDTMTVGDRAFAGLTVASSQGYGTSIEYQSDRGKNLLDALEELSESSGLGFRIKFAKTGLTFEVLQGLDRSAEQSTNPRAIFSRGFENVLSQKYVDDAQKYKNVAYVEFEHNDNTITEIVGSVTGRNRREVHIKASGLVKDESGVELTLLQQLGLMAEKGTEKLATMPVEESLSVDADPYGNLAYKDHYNLGDIVTVVDGDYQQDKRITQVKEVHEKSGFKLTLTMGYVSPIKKIVRWLIDG